MDLFEGWRGARDEGSQEAFVVTLERGENNDQNCWQTSMIGLRIQRGYASRRLTGPVLRELP